MRKHYYTQQIIWTGNKGQGTSAYDAYGREFDWVMEGKPTLHGSSDTPFRGDASKPNPEDMLLASISSCHMLWYLHLCADAGITVINYTDQPEAWMLNDAGNGGRFEKAILHPQVEILQKDMADLAQQLHHLAGKKCFVANSLNFPIEYDSTVV